MLTEIIFIFFIILFLCCVKSCYEIYKLSLFKRYNYFHHKDDDYEFEETV